jgi:2'-5' RNA ligase
MKKVFLAIRIPINTKIESYLTDYKKSFSFVDMRWNESRYLHLTLKYFGPTSEKRIKKLEKLFSELFREQGVLRFSIVKLGVFGSKYAPKVMWWGIEEEEMMKELFYKIEESLKSIGIHSDRQNFVPHITLARIKNVISKPSFQYQMKKYKEVKPIEVEVSDIVLLESKRVEEGVEYLEIAKFTL